MRFRYEIASKLAPTSNCAKLPPPATMRLFEAILEVNQRRVAGDKGATVPVAEHSAALPLAALTCIDARLNHFLPNMLGIPEDHFIWLRNAGNIVTGPLSSTMRSLALACAVKGAKEIAIIGHSDCLVGKTTTLQLLDRLASLGVDRHHLPENLIEYFGLFGTERQNVIRGVEFVRVSPLIGGKIPVHGLLIDVHTGRLEWVVNGYEKLDAVVTGKVGELFKKADHSFDAFAKIGNTAAEELKLPESKIGDIVSTARDWLNRAEHVAAAAQQQIGQKSGAAGSVPLVGSTPLAKTPQPKVPRLQEELRQFAASIRPIKPPDRR
jgi:carbonic anhydrase